MSVELFRTVVPVEPAGEKITYKSGSLLIGSCFTENIGDKLRWYKLPVIINPFGIVYNPISIKQSLMRLISGEKYSLNDLNQRDGIFYSFDHHSRFSHTDPDTCVQNINLSFEEARNSLSQISHLFITFGTSYYYLLKSTGKIVSNCHKLPDKEFLRQRLTVAMIVEEYNALIPELSSLNKNLKIVFTVSPIRHWKDGAHENQVSKSALLLAIDELCAEFRNVSYFPAYELMMDELRDYRFYEDDMLHPNRTAIDFIWTRFLECFTDKATQNVMKGVESVQVAKQHRPFNTTSEIFKKFVQQQLHKIDRLVNAYPGLDFSEESAYFKNYL